jgi:hypothetical protein
VEWVRICENRSSFGHQNDSRGVEYVHGNGEKKKINNKFEHEESVWKSGPTEFSNF